MRLVVDNAMLAWFREHYGEATEIQRQMWQCLSGTEHVLAVAPTGSGKTMAVFFPVLLELLLARPAYEGITVLYISPLKALNNDMQRNLLKPLLELRTYFHERGESVNQVRVAVRSGDSTPRERKAVETNPPAILATTPESVQILLLSRHAKRLLSSVRLVIIDEIHALMGTKRGSHLFALLELLEELSPGMRRAALSATVRDEEGCARLLGGYDARGRARPVSRVRVPAGKPRRIQLAWPSFDDAPLPSGMHPGVLPSGTPTRAKTAASVPLPGLLPSMTQQTDMLARMGPAFRHIIEKNRSTLFFTNSRRLAERMAALINREFGEHVAASHHGSLSRELRLAVESALKQGTLRAVVATNSLELGIDIGQLDAVVLIGSPTGVAGAIQRTGRAAHHPGGEGSVTLFPTHARDALEAMALSGAVARQELEEQRMPESPLDILAQFVLAASASEERASDWLFARARCSAPFVSLPRADFERVLWMLAGISNGRRHAALPVRARYDGSVFASAESTLFLLRVAGGTIPPRSGLAMRDAESKAVLGELDEEFVFERRVGDVFRFANRVWRFLGQDDQGVLVSQLTHAEGLMPFWRAERADSSDTVLAELHALLDAVHEDYEGKFFECARAYSVGGGTESSEEYKAGAASREKCDIRVAARDATVLGVEPNRLNVSRAYAPSLAGAGPLRTESAQKQCSPSGSAGRGPEDPLFAELAKYIEAHRHEGGFALPGSRSIIGEEISTDAMPGRTFCLLTARGARVNRTFSLAFSVWGEERGYARLHLHLDNDALLIGGIPGGQGLESFLIEFFQAFDRDLVMRGLYRSHHFGMRFRDAAARSLVLPRDLPGRFRPFWKFRERARTLLTGIAADSEMPLFREAARECVREILDIEGAERLAGEVLAGTVRLFCYTHDAPSPMAQGVLWARTNELLYAVDDSPACPVRIAAEVPRGRIGEEALRALGERLEGIRASFRDDAEDGLLLANAPDLIDWLRLRILVSEDIFKKASGTLAVEKISDIEFLDSAEPGHPGVVFYRADISVVQSIQTCDENAAGHLCQWLQYRGPECRADIAKFFRMDEAILSGLVDSLIEMERAAVLDDGRVLSRENLDWVLRYARNARRREVRTERPLTDLPLFTAAAQGLYDSLRGLDGLALALEKLFACAVPAELWESEILPLRLCDYRPALLDELFAEGDLLWTGGWQKHITILPKREAHTYHDFPEAGGASAESVLPGAGRLYSFEELLRFHKTDSASLSARLWQGVFAGEISNTTWGAVRSGLAGSFHGGMAAGASGGRGAYGASAGPGASGLSGTHGAPAAPGVSAAPEVSAGYAGEQRGAAPGRSGFMRWRSGRPDGGSWFALLDQGAGQGAGQAALPQGGVSAGDDALAENIRLRARLDLLFQRWGIVSREIAQGSGLFPSWHTAYRELVRMEMEGEIVAGRYFAGVSGVQFMPAQLLPAFLHLERRAARTFIASISDPIFPPIPQILQGVRRAGNAGVVMTKRGIGAALFAGGKRLVLCDAARECADDIAGVLFERARARMRTLTIREVQGPGREEVIAALLERGARLCAPGRGVEVSWRTETRGDENKE